MSIVAVLNAQRVVRHRARIYELSSRGPLVKYLKKRHVQLTCSEYFDNIKPGLYRDSVQCQDVQKLTYPDRSFDLCTSTEVFEHVPDDMMGFRELRRVLDSGGAFVFTVPLTTANSTVERAKLTRTGIKYILPATYHGDVIRGSERVLVYRDYGYDIRDRLLKAGFSAAEIVESELNRYLGYGSYVIVARA